MIFYLYILESATMILLMWVHMHMTMSISLLESDEFLLVYSWKRDHDFAHVGAYAWLYEHIIIEKLYYMPMAKLSSIKDAFL
jgi:hypothetical protein